MSGSSVASARSSATGLRVTLPESPTISNLQLHDAFRAAWSSSTTARKVAFVSNGGGVASSTLVGGGLTVTGDQTTVDAIHPTLHSRRSRFEVADVERRHVRSGRRRLRQPRDVTNHDGDPSPRVASTRSSNSTQSSSNRPEPGGTTLDNTFDGPDRRHGVGRPRVQHGHRDRAVPSVSIAKTASRSTADAARHGRVRGHRHQRVRRERRDRARHARHRRHAGRAHARTGVRHRDPGGGAPARPTPRPAPRST